MLHAIPTELPSVILRLVKEEDAAAFSSLINQNHEYLREWLPWVGESSDVSHELEFINACSEPAAAGMESIMRVQSRKKGMKNTEGFVTEERRGYYTARPQRSQRQTRNSKAQLRDYVIPLTGGDDEFLVFRRWAVVRLVFTRLNSRPHLTLRQPRKDLVSRFYIFASLQDFPVRFPGDRIPALQGLLRPQQGDRSF
jgi:hypothetical protein